MQPISISSSSKRRRHRRNSRHPGAGVRQNARGSVEVGGEEAAGRGAEEESPSWLFFSHPQSPGSSFPVLGRGGGLRLHASRRRRRDERTLSCSEESCWVPPDLLTLPYSEVEREKEREEKKENPNVVACSTRKSSNHGCTNHSTTGSLSTCLRTPVPFPGIHGRATVLLAAPSCGCPFRLYRFLVLGLVRFYCFLCACDGERIVICLEEVWRGKHRGTRRCVRGPCHPRSEERENQLRDGCLPAGSRGCRPGG